METAWGLTPHFLLWLRSCLRAQTRPDCSPVPRLQLPGPGRLRAPGPPRRLDTSHPKPRALVAEPGRWLFTPTPAPPPEPAARGARARGPEGCHEPRQGPARPRPPGTRDSERGPGGRRALGFGCICGGGTFRSGRGRGLKPAEVQSRGWGGPGSCRWKGPVRA